MASTRRLHDDTFLKLACWWQEGVFEASEAFWPSHLPPPANVQPVTACERAMWADAADRYAASLEVFRRVETARFRAAGISEDQLRTLALQNIIDENAAARVLLVGVTDQRKSVRPRSAADADDVWTPQRTTVVDVVAGVYFSIGSHQRTRTAQLLNRGMPNGQRRSGVTPSEVRNVLDTLLDRLRWNSERAALVARVLAFRVLVLNRMWERYTADPKLRQLSGPVVADHLRATGKIYEWQADAAADLAFPSVDELHVARLCVKRLEERYRKAVRRETA